MMIPKLIVITVAALSLQLGGTQGAEEVSKKEPLSVYQKYKGLAESGYRGWIITTIIGACKSIDGDCDVGSLATLDFMITNQKTYLSFINYKDYCWEQWLTRCDAQEALGARIDQILTPEQQEDVESLAQRVLSPQEESDDHQKRYPKAIVDFMQDKMPEIDSIRNKFFGKKDKFIGIYDQIIRKLCNLCFQGLKAHVEALNKWLEKKSMEEKDLSTETKHWLEIYKVCGDILSNHKLIGNSYNHFRGKPLVE